MSCSLSPARKKSIQNTRLCRVLRTLKVQSIPTEQVIQQINSPRQFLEICPVSTAPGLLCWACKLSGVEYTLILLNFITPFSDRSHCVCVSPDRFSLLHCMFSIILFLFVSHWYFSHLVQPHFLPPHIHLASLSVSTYEHMFIFSGTGTPTTRHPIHPLTKLLLSDLSQASPF